MRITFLLDNRITLALPSTYTTHLRIRFPKSQTVGTPTARIYKVGDTPPAFSGMTSVFPSSTTWDYEITTVEFGSTFILEYKDSSLQLILGKLIAYGGNADPCSASGSGTIIVSSTGVTVSSNGSTQASINAGATYKPASSGSTSWTNSELTSLGLTVKINEIKLINDFFSCPSTTVGYDFALDSVVLPPMVVTPSVSNVTVNGGSDGAISLVITGGSGLRTYSWSDGPTTQNRTGLTAGTYTVTVHDVTTGENVVLPITVTEPVLVPPSPEGTFLIVPALNSITFVTQSDINDCYNPQGLDNVLLCEQEYEGFDQTNYFQKICKCDIPSTQFNSDFVMFDISLRKYRDNTFVKSFPFTLKETNIGATQDFSITIRNHTGIGQSRVYFNLGVIPIPLAAGESFEILNNFNGYNGVYSIVSILNDTVLGQQYLVITKSFTGSPVQTGTGRFLITTVDFNVFESIHDFTDVPDGEYFIIIRAFNAPDAGSEKIAISEPIDVRTTHEGTVLIKGRNEDNAFGMTWTTGIQTILRIPGHFGHRRTPGGERSISRNSDYSVIKINAKKTRVLLLQVWSLPPYLHEKLNVLCDCDSLSVNLITCQTAEAYADPEYKDRFILANSSVKLETKWFDNYNSDDIGSVADGGFISTESGFLKQ